MLYALINSGKFNEAYNYSKKLNKIKKVLNNLIMGIFYLKNLNMTMLVNIFLKPRKKGLNQLDNYLVNSFIFKVQNYI